MAGFDHLHLPVLQNKVKWKAIENISITNRPYTIKDNMKLGCKPSYIPEYGANSISHQILNRNLKGI
jgi:hypothetical protein